MIERNERQVNGDRCKNVSVRDLYQKAVIDVLNFYAN